MTQNNETVGFLRFLYRYCMKCQYNATRIAPRLSMLVIAYPPQNSPNKIINFSTMLRYADQYE